LRFVADAGQKVAVSDWGLTAYLVACLDVMVRDGGDYVRKEIELGNVVLRAFFFLFCPLCSDVVATVPRGKLRS
jgi:hypothetical protein